MGNENPQQSDSKPNRRSIRLPGYDYSQAGAYFVTICTQNREMVLYNAGRMVKTVWNELPKFYPRVSIDAFQIMPNHIHGIIVIAHSDAVSSVGAGPCACPFVAQPQGAGQPPGDDGQPPGDDGQPQGVAPTGVKPRIGRALSLPDIVHRFKTMTTKRYSDGVKQHGWPSFPGKLWQRNYYEHIIRDEDDKAHILEYINNNPAQWDTDRENPMAKTNHNLRGPERHK